MAEQTKQSFSRRQAVKNRLGKSTTALYQDMADGLFPRPIRIGLRAVAWLDHEIDAVIAARVAGKSQEQIKELVRRLVADRAKNMI